jgi:hypothetical protein
MSIDRDGWICKRAYALWEEAGRPDAMDNHNWCQAVAEFEMMQRTKASSDGAEVVRFRTNTNRIQRRPSRVWESTAYGR